MNLGMRLLLEFGPAASGPNHWPSTPGPFRGQGCSGPTGSSHEPRATAGAAVARGALAPRLCTLNNAKFSLPPSALCPFLPGTPLCPRL